MSERTREKGAWGYLSGAETSVTGGSGRGALGWEWPSWAVAFSCGGLGVRGARGFGRMRVSRGAKAGMPTVQSHLRM
jgi:hypothetical protein